MIKITPAAESVILEVLDKPEIKDVYCLRIGLAGGACTSKYVFGFDKKTNNDQLFIVNNIPIIIENKHLMFLINKTIDYIKDDSGSYFGLID